MIKNRFYADNGVDYAAQQCLEGFGTLDLPQQIAGYKPRPLEGVWSTAPFLHNGSVPTLYQMLLPPAKRDTKFFVGRREYDPVHVGFVTCRTTMATMTASGSTPPSRAITTRVTRSRPMRQPGQSTCRIRRRIHCRAGVIGPEFTDDERYAHHRIPEGPSRSAGDACRLSAAAMPAARGNIVSDSSGAVPAAEYSPDFADVEHAESAWIRERRAATASVPPDAPLVGLALSGGGIRSAAFNMGVLQTLAHSGLLARVDYLSSVSGGGYIASCLTWLRAHVPASSLQRLGACRLRTEPARCSTGCVRTAAISSPAKGCRAGRSAPASCPARCSTSSCCCP